MPVVPIIAAGVAWAGAAGAVGAVAAGGLSALTLTGALAITAAVGATIGAVGVITHDKGLMTAGLIIGGIGGIGGLAASAGLFGAEASTASLFGEGMAADYLPGAVGALPASSAGLQAGTQNIIDSFGAVDAGNVAQATGVVDQAALAGGAASDQLTGSLLNGTPVDPTGGAAVPPVPHVQSAVQPISVDTSALAPPAPAAPTNFAESLDQVTGPAAVSGQLAPVPTEAPGVLDTLGAFAKNNPLTTYGMIQTGGAFVQGLFDPVAPAQVEALGAQTAKTNAEAGLTANQLANVKQPIPVATRANGMINTGVTP